MESPISFKTEKEKLIEAERIGVAEHMAIEVRSKFAKLFGGKSKVTDAFPKQIKEFKTTPSASMMEICPKTRILIGR
jgi:hypothetical protein